MTAIATWIANEDAAPYLYLVSDSRVTVPGSPNTTYTDRCAKIFALPVICRLIEPSAGIIYERRVGFAYAGSALIGLNAAAAIGTLFSGLSTVPHTAPPSMEQLSEMARSIFSSIALDVGETAPHSADGAEATLCGYCSLHQRFEIYHLKSSRLASGHYQARATLVPPSDILLLGESKNELHRRISAVRSNHSPHDIDWQSAPLSVIEHAIRTQLSPSIGGSIQIGIDRGSGMEIWASCEPVTRGQPEARIVLQGFDIEAIPAPKNYLPATKMMVPGPSLDDDYTF